MYPNPQAFSRCCSAAKRFCGRLTLGEAANKWWRSQAYYDDGGWKGTQALDGGGALMNQAIHNVDLLLWLMGPAASVCGLTATLAHERIEVEDTAVAAIRFRSGALGVLTATTSVHPGYPKQIAVHGDKGSAVIEQEDVLKWDFTPSTADDAAVIGAARTLLERGVRTVVTTLGRRGAVLCSPGRALRAIAPVVDVVDTTGAGDAFGGVFAARLAAGASQQDALRCAVAAGSLAVQGATARGHYERFADLAARADGLPELTVLSER